MTKKCGPEFGGLLWRHLTPQKNRNVGAQLRSITCIIAQKNVLENLLPVCLLVRTIFAKIVAAQISRKLWRHLATKISTTYSAFERAIDAGKRYKQYQSR